jgi:hypothetical protein
MLWIHEETEANPRNDLNPSVEAYNKDLQLRMVVWGFISLCQPCSIVNCAMKNPISDSLTSRDKDS